jgi:hypothetical protein
LRGVGSPAEEKPSRSKGKRPDPEDDEAYPPFANDADPWKAHFAEIDALLDRTSKVLAGETPLLRSRSHLVYDPIRMKLRPKICGWMWSSAPATGQPSRQLRWRGMPGWISTSTPACPGSG